MLSVVVPVFNEQDVLPLFLERLRPVLEATADPYEIVLVDDGSTDQTPTLMNAIATSWAQVHVLRLRLNAGHQAALTAGLVHASGEWVITIDADLQDPPELISEMLASASADKADVVYAVRADRSRDSIPKRMTAGIYYRMMRSLVGSDIPKHAGDYRLMSRRVVDELNRLPERHRVYRLLVPHLGYPSSIVQYSRTEREAGETKYSTTKMIRLAADSVTSFSAAPLRLATWLGGIGAFLSAVLAVVSIGAWLTGATVPGWTSVMVAVLFMGAIQLLSFGLFGEYLGRIFSELQGRPLYYLADNPLDRDQSNLHAQQPDQDG